MRDNDVREFIGSDILTRQLHLLNDIQGENLVGSWERTIEEEHFFWSDSMFALHEIPVSPGNTISIEEAAAFIHPDDRALVQEKREELEHFAYADFYLRIITPDEKIKRIHAREKKAAVNGAVVYRGNWQDEVREKESQLPLKDVNQQQSLQLKHFERAEEVAQSGSWQINLETLETIYSDNVYRLHGLSPQGIPAHVDSFRKFIHPEDRTIVLKTQEKAYIEMIPLHLEYRIVREDGQVRHISQASHLFKNEKGQHILCGTTRDITEQKLLELELREANDILTLQNELFIQAEKIGELGTWRLNLDTRKAIYSDNLYRIYGLKPQSVQPGLDNFIGFIHPDDREHLRTAYTLAMEQRIAPNITFKIIRADGKARTLRQVSRFIRGADGELMIGIVQDITEREQQERLLKDINNKLVVQNESFRQAEKVAAIGSWTWNLQTNEITYSDNIYTIYGLRPQSVAPGFDHFIKYIHPDDRGRMSEVPEKIRTEPEPLTVEYRIIRPDGELRYLRSRNQPLTTVDGQTIIIGTMQDITEEVNMQHELLEKIRFAELLQDSLPDRIIVTDTANNIISWNRTCELIYRQQKEDVLGKNFFDVLPHAKVPEVIDRFRRVLNGETIHLPVMPILQMPGYQELLMVPVKNEDGKVIGILHVLHDITQQQQLQQQLGERLQFIEKLQEASIDSIMVLDTDLYFKLWNRQCEKYYGMTKEQVVGKHILEVFPKFKLDPLYRQCLRALEGETIHVPANDQPGMSGYQESYFVPLKNERREVTGLLWIMHDLTERFEAELQLLESRHFIQQVTDSVPDLIYVLDVSEQKIVFINDRVEHLLGYKPGHVYTAGSMILKEKLHPDDYEKRMAHIEALADMQDDEVKEIDVRLSAPDGSWRWFRIRDRLFKRHKDGSVWQTIGTAQDITDKKFTDEQILKQRELLQQAEEIGHLGSWELNPETGRMLWSDEIFRIYGYAPQCFEPEMEFYFETLHPEDRRQLIEAIEKTKLEGTAYSLTCRIFTLDGELRFLQTRGRAMHNEFGKVTHVIGTMQDITEHKVLEEELRRKNESMRFMYHMDRQTQKIRNIGNWQWNLQTGKLIWSENVYHMFGLKPYTFDPTFENFMELIHPEDRAHIEEDMNNISEMNEGPLPNYEFRIQVKGQLKYMRSVSRLAKGKMVVGTIIDITEDALLHQELSDKIRQLQDMNEELSSFAFVASHDLREPLRKIQIFSDWLCQKESNNLSADGIDRFRRIQAAVARMDALIDDILSFSRVTTTPKKFDDTDLNQVLETVKGDLQETILATAAVIENASLPVVKCNASQFTQLFQNLLSNALKYRKPDAAPHIRINAEIIEGKNLRHTPANHDMMYVKIAFADNGIGFDPQYARKIFQMFQRLHGINEYPGTGMGLAICKKIVEHHGGFMVAGSEPGNGSVFECYVPHDNPARAPLKKEAATED